MRVRINALDLVGTTRSITLTSGLNIITGPIATGKTTLLRLCRAVFGSDLDNMPVEAREQVTAIVGDVTLGDADFKIIRPLVTTADAKVDIAGRDVALRLPALRPRPEAPITYGQWLLSTLALPRIEVPSDPRRPESTGTPVSINDYFMYCHLRQTEIDRSVFGHHDHFRNVKRKYVFEILYGLYDVAIANLQERLRDLDGQLRALRGETAFFERISTGTPWENRAALERDLGSARVRLQVADDDVRAIAASSAAEGAARELQSEYRELTESIAERSAALSHEDSAIEQLERLAAQLEAQTTRLTKAIVAGEVLADYDFILCPRCGASLNSDRGSADHCYLCLQQPTRTTSRSDLVKEQARLDAQGAETRELIDSHRNAMLALKHQIDALERRRLDLDNQLDFKLKAFVSRSASEIEHFAASRAELHQTIRRLEDYLTLFARLDGISSSVSRLEIEREDVRAELARAESRQSEAEERIQKLEARFSQILQRFHSPQFGISVEAQIDRQTYLPIVNGRPFDQIHSLGLNVLVNVAHALAHHLITFELGLPLPQILLVDGLTSHIGHEGLDQARVNAVYDYLAEVSDSLGDQIQIIVADNTVPPQARRFVRIELSDSDRLIPQGVQ